MHTYTAIIFPLLLLVGNALSSEALMTGNKLKLSKTFVKYSHSNSVQSTQHKASEPEQSGAREFVNTICISSPDNTEICPFHRGSGRKF